jgi:hypothetical protein
MHIIGTILLQFLLKGLQSGDIKLCATIRARHALGGGIELNGTTAARAFILF